MSGVFNQIQPLQDSEGENMRMSTFHERKMSLKIIAILEFEQGGTRIPENMTGSVKVLESRDPYCGGCNFDQSH